MTFWFLILLMGELCRDYTELNNFTILLVDFASEARVE